MPLRFCACSLQGEGAESKKSGKKVREKQDLKGFKKNQVHCKLNVIMIKFAFHKDLFVFNSSPLLF